MALGAKKKVLRRVEHVRPVHQIKEVKGNDVLTKCLMKTTKSEATVWWRDVTCGACRG